VEVRENAQQRPVSVRIKRRWFKVVSIDDLYIVDTDEEWWRERPIVRMYYLVTTEDGGHITIFRDLVDGVWHRQCA
jgi:hypothetical protein